MVDGKKGKLRLQMATGLNLAADFLVKCAVYQLGYTK